MQRVRFLDVSKVQRERNSSYRGREIAGAEDDISRCEQGAEGEQ